MAGSGTIQRQAALPAVSHFGILSYNFKERRPGTIYKLAARTTELNDLYRFINSEVNRFVPWEICSAQFIKVPIEKAGCMVTGGGQGLRRERVVSNQRFRLGALHSEIMARVQVGHALANARQRHAVIRCYDYKPWIKIIDTAHEQSTWVVCIDPAIDDQLLHNMAGGRERRREIIGFGSGVGAHGESNFTVSTEEFVMVDIKNKISQQIAALLGPWEIDICDRIAESLIKEALHIAGLSRLNNRSDSSMSLLPTR